MEKRFNRHGKYGTIEASDSPRAVEQAARDRGTSPTRIAFQALTVEDELKALDEADLSIAFGNARIRRQIELIHELENDGHSTLTARRLLTVLNETERVMLGYRKSIIEQIERLKARDA